MVWPHLQGRWGFLYCILLGKNMRRGILFVFLLLFFFNGLLAQPGGNYLQSIIQDKKALAKAGIQYPGLVREFYLSNGYKPAWINEEGRLQREALINLLSLSDELGLNESDYQFGFVRSYRKGELKLLSTNDSVNTELLFTDAALHFFCDVAFGNKPPALGYDGLHFNQPFSEIPVLLNQHLQNKELLLLPGKLSEGLPEIKIVLHKLQQLQKRTRQENFTEVTVAVKSASASNSNLVLKLYQLGFLDSTQNVTDAVLKQKIKEAQQSFGLLDDAVIRSTFLQELNVPLQARVNQLAIALNNYRWLKSFAQRQKVIVANIPAAYLKVHEKDSVILQMKLIVGKPSTPTPTLLSEADEVVLYPYWHVPYSIATKELLPLIKKAPNFLEQGNYQVLNRQGKIMNPHKINWRRLSTKYFPYIIRQATGCDNSLGLLKVNFYSPFGVYLHDTPFAGLFGTNKRFYSHGCMRMEKPFELGHLLLKDNSIAIDTLEEKGCLLNQSPVAVPVKEKIPVLVWYNPVAVNAEGKLVFYEDIYKKLFR